MRIEVSNCSAFSRSFCGGCRFWSFCFKRITLPRHRQKKMQDAGILFPDSFTVVLSVVDDGGKPVQNVSYLCQYPRYLQKLFTAMNKEKAA